MRRDGENCDPTAFENQMCSKFSDDQSEKCRKLSFAFIKAGLFDTASCNASLGVPDKIVAWL